MKLPLSRWLLSRPLRSWLGWLLVGSLLWVACTAPTGTPAGNETAATLVDNFSTVSPHWALFDTPAMAARITAGEFYLEDRGQGLAVYAPWVNATWTQVVLRFQVRQVEGSFNNWMGALCRQQDEENYYLFAISADGYYLIQKTENGVSTPLVGPTFTPTIRTGQTSNRLEIHCEGSTLSLAVNDIFLVSRADRTFATGGIALFADAVTPGETTTVAFDNFSLTGR